MNEHKAMENVSLFTFYFCILDFLFFKSPKDSDADRKVVIGRKNHTVLIIINTDT